MKYGPTIPAELLRLPATVILCLAGAAFYTVRLWDPDYFFHLKAGEYIVQRGALPATDPFLFTQEGQPWVLHEWLFEVVLYLAHRFAGAAGVRSLSAILFALCSWVVFTTARRYLSEVGAIVLIALVSVPIFIGLAPRPHLVTYLFFAVYLLLLLDYVDRGTERGLWFLPLLMVVWANMHGGFLVGIVLEILVLLGILLTRRLCLEDGAVARARVQPLLVATALTVVAGAATPYHFGHYLYPFKVTGLWITQRISEWQPPALAGLSALPYLLILAAWLVAQVLRRSRPSPMDLTIGAALIYLSFTSFRHLPLAALALVVGIARASADGARESALELVRRLLGGAVSAYSRRARKELGVHAERRLNASVLIAAFAAVAIAVQGLEERQLKSGDAVIGWRAIEFIQASGVQGRVFNEYGFGGYLTYRLWPGVRAFIDGRADIFSDDFSRDYIRIFNGDEGWRAALDRYEVDLAIVPRSAPLRQLLLESHRFHEIYADEHNVVLKRADR